MAYVLGVIVAGVQFPLFRWLMNKWPIPLSVVGYVAGAIIVALGISMVRNPYVGEVHAALFVALSIGALYVIVDAFLLGGPFFRALGLAFLGVAMIFPVSLAVTWLRDNASPFSATTQVESHRVWTESCDQFTAAFGIAWLVIMLLAPPIMRASANTPRTVVQDR